MFNKERTNKTLLYKMLEVKQWTSFQTSICQDSVAFLRTEICRDILRLITVILEVIYEKVNYSVKQN